MKWYYFGPLSLFLCALSGLLGWFIGGHDNPNPLCGSVVVVVAAAAAMCSSTDFKRRFPNFNSNVGYTILFISCGVIYTTALVINHHLTLPSTRWYLNHF